MKQYLDLLKEIKETGTIKPAARANMPSTLSLFGAQYRCNLSEGFPLLTTKKVSFKNIVTELLWFLNGDTNIKYLVERGCNIWNEDAYNFYKKKCNKYGIPYCTFDEFENYIKTGDEKYVLPYNKPKNYNYGDCGWQYGRLWRNWDFRESENKYVIVDQIGELIHGLRRNPESRRHILTALNPAHYDDLALFPCHTTVQFNCRPLDNLERSKWAVWNGKFHRNELMFDSEQTGLTLDEQLNEANVPKYYLDCHLYQRSCDVFLGVPYNTASYSLLTHFLSKMCNMIAGDFIHTFGDVHIYENHYDAVDEQLSRKPFTLPTLEIKGCPRVDWEKSNIDIVLKSISGFEDETFILHNYNHHPSIKAKLSTGLK